MRKVVMEFTISVHVIVLRHCYSISSTDLRVCVCVIFSHYADLFRSSVCVAVVVVAVVDAVEIKG